MPRIYYYILQLQPTLTGGATFTHTHTHVHRQANYIYAHLDEGHCGQSLLCKPLWVRWHASCGINYAATITTTATIEKQLSRNRKEKRNFNKYNKPIARR